MLPAKETGKSFDIVVSDGADTVTLSNVIRGDVFVCSGGLFRARARLLHCLRLVANAMLTPVFVPEQQARATWRFPSP